VIRWIGQVIAAFLKSKSRLVAENLCVRLCLLLIPSAAEILGFQTIFSQCEQSVRVLQNLAKFLGR